MMLKRHSVNAAIVVGLLVSVFSAGVVYAAQIQLASETEIQVRFQKDVSSGVYQAGDTVPIELVQPVDIGGLIIIESGALGRAEVVEVEKVGRAGKPGRIKVKFVSLSPKGKYHLAAGEGDAIGLIAEEPEVKGKGRKTLSYLLIFGLFIKGNNAVIPAHEIFTVKTEKDLMFETK